MKRINQRFAAALIGCATACVTASGAGAARASDWREEVIWPTSGDIALRIYSTTDSTSISRPSLMQDRQYRLAVAWHNTAYNQPPHPSFAIG